MNRCNAFGIALFLGALAAPGALPAATPAQMRAIVQEGNGGPEVLQLRRVAVAEPAAGQVLIRVYAAAVNPIDWKLRTGERPRSAPAPAPGGAATDAARIPGLDVAGVIEKVGSGVTQFRPGDAVFSMIGHG